MLRVKKLRDRVAFWETVLDVFIKQTTGLALGNQNVSGRAGLTCTGTTKRALKLRGKMGIGIGPLCPGKTGIWSLGIGKNVKNQKWEWDLIIAKWDLEKN